MHRALIAAFIALSASACAYQPTTDELIQTVDSPADVRYCQNLGDVSPVNLRERGSIVPTTPGFEASLWGMQQATRDLGGTHLYLEKRAHDWSLVRGVAYLCDARVVRDRVVIRAKG